MGRLYIPADNQIDGPWLLSHSKLESLNTLFLEVDHLLKAALEKTILATAKQQAEEENQTLDLQKRIAKLQRKYNQKSKLAEVTFDDGTTYEAEDVEGIINYVDTNPKQRPTELYIRSIHGNYENEFVLIVDTQADHQENEYEFEYRIRCIDEEIQQKIKSIIDRWIRENRPNKVLQLWTNKLLAFVWVAGVITILIAWGNLTDVKSQTDQYTSSLTEKAKTIIEHPAANYDRDSVLMLLLKLQTDYIPGTIKVRTIEVPNLTAYKVLYCTLIIFLVSLVKPKTVIGIGAKETRYKIYKIWIQVISYTIGLVVAAVLTDSFSHFSDYLISR